MIKKIINKANCYAAEMKFVQKHIYIPPNYIARLQYIAADIMKDCQQLVTEKIHSEGFVTVLCNELHLLISSGTQLNCYNLYQLLFKPLLDKCPISELTSENIDNLVSKYPDQVVEISAHPKLQPAKALEESPSPTMSHDSAIELDYAAPQAKRFCYNPLDHNFSLAGESAVGSLYCDEELF